MRATPYRIETPRLVIRCWEPRDAPLLKPALDASLDHLRPWMPWAHFEPTPLPELAERLRRFRGRFDMDEEHVLGIFSADEAEVLGGTGLHPSSAPDGLEIGYWIAAAHEGRGYVSETVAALTRVAIELVGARRVGITCAPDNDRSAAVPRRLGYVEEGVLRGWIASVDGEPRDARVFSLLPDEYRRSPCFDAPLGAFDAAGNRML